MEPIIAALIKKHYPERVWEKTSNGWASRAATKEDYVNRRNWIIKHYKIEEANELQ
jgi:hypothetical protein